MRLRAWLLLLLLPCPALAQPYVEAVAREAYDDTLATALRLAPAPVVIVADPEVPTFRFTFPHESADQSDPMGTPIAGTKAGVRKLRVYYLTDTGRAGVWWGLAYRSDRDSMQMVLKWSADGYYNDWINVGATCADSVGNWQPRIAWITWRRVRP